MKTNLLKSALLIASVFGAFSSASAETLHARIPFAFSADGTSLPAGTYIISSMTHIPEVLLFENEETKVQTLVFARAAMAMPAKLASPLTFTADSSESMALTNIATDDRTYELNMRSARRGLKGVALTLTSGGK